MPESEMRECGPCGEETEHRAIVEVVTESDEGEPFSREPYRILKCTQCGEQNYHERMNQK